MIRSQRSRFFTALTSFGLFTLAASAQQTVCLSLHGTATGTNSVGQPGQVAARVQGVHVAVPTTAGQSAAAASAAHQAAFTAAGFATTRTGPNVFCLTAAPGGAPITSGSCYGTDDLGLDLDSDVAVPLPPGPVPAPAAAAKANGAVVPLPPVQQPPQPFGGTIVVWIWIKVGTQRVLVIVQIQLPPNVPGGVLRQIIAQQLLAQGLLGNVVKIEDPFHSGQRW